MSYIGENQYFSFRDGFCEPISDKPLSASVCTMLGHTVSPLFRRIAIGCADDSLRHFVFALASGISECGTDCFICETSAMPAFRYALNGLSADCGVFFNGDAPTLRFFDKNGFPLCDNMLSCIMNGAVSEITRKCGCIVFCPNIEHLYYNSIADSMNDGFAFPLHAFVSCGNKRLRRLWQKIFSEDDDLVFQISDDGSIVNAYSTEFGFISYEKLVLAYGLALGEKVYLPNSFHYAADILAEKGKLSLKRFDPFNEVPDEAVKQRFLSDTLFMCAKLAADTSKFYELLRSIPKFASAKRDIPLSDCDCFKYPKIFNDSRGRVIITQSGKNRAALLAQSFDSETAAEICSVWNSNIRTQNSCKNLLHGDE